jgi:hypothetical protein
MDEQGLRAEQLVTLSSGARRVSDLVAAAAAPLRYEVLRHLLRLAEEGMIEVLGEAVDARLVKRGADPFTYVPHDEATGDAVREALGLERVARYREQIASATRRVLEE